MPDPTNRPPAPGPDPAGVAPVKNEKRFSPRRMLRLLKARAWQQAALAIVSAWNRNQLRRIVVAILLLWLLGGVGLHFAEGGNHNGFDGWGESLWNAWVILFSGVSNPPVTAAGRVLAMLLLVAGVAVAGLFTATVASVLVEHYLRRREVTTFEMGDHLVLCNWAPRGLEWIREVHSSIITQAKRPVVIIHDNPDDIDLPDKQDDPAFSDVYIVKGDPVNEVVLRRAKVPKAHSVVVLTDERQGDHADGKTILTCIAVRNVCKADKQPNVAVECHNPKFRGHLRKAGADEVISANDMGLRLLARAALYHGMTRLYQELLTVGRDANEVYLVPVTAALLGRSFVEVSEMFLRHRGDKRACLLIGVQRGETMMLNPVGGEAGPLKDGDQMILLSQVYPDPAQPLPTEPPLDAAPEKA